MELENILKQLTLEERIALCSGADDWHTKDLSRFGLPSMMMSDGPHGLRCQKNKTDMLGINCSEPATCFPTASLTACSWDPDLLGELGHAIATEAGAMDVALVLGPGVNIKRDPLCGRNFEYFSEDPYLAGSLATSFIQKAQETGVGTSLKHFALNNQEYKRFNGDSLVDERTMREIYLPAFEQAVKEGRPHTVMCAYNKLNGIHCSDHRGLLTGILRDEWGFEGLVVSDWSAMHDRREGFRAGCDLNMPGGSDYMEREVKEAVLAGTLSEKDIDRCAMNVLKLMKQASELKMPFSFDGSTKEKHHLLARRAAAESAVLLKNQDGLLPLDPSRAIALIGVMADKPRYQGSGSSHINPFRLVSAREALDHLRHSPETSAAFSGEVIYAAGCLEDGSTNRTLVGEAVQAAKRAETAVIFAGLTDIYESEGFDRENLNMPAGHLQLIEAVSAVNPNTVVILQCGSVVECPWEDRVRSIVFMGLAGQACGEAVMDLLFGKVNPSGKLAESWPMHYEDCATANNYRGIKNPQYREGIYVGYRYYDKAECSVRWPFGHGLSYTEFSYTDLQIRSDLVSVTITNTGQRAGAEIAQLYIAAPSEGLHRPVKELKGFAKIMLEPGQSKTVDFALTPRSFALWQDGWKIPGGDYEILVGPSSHVLPLKGRLTVKGEKLAAPDWQKGSWYEQPHGTPTQAQWEPLYGKAVVDAPLKKGKFTMDNTIMEMKDHSLIMKLMYRAVELFMSSRFGWKRDYTNPEFKMMMTTSLDAPLRTMQMFIAHKGGLFQGLLRMANGRRR